MCVCVPESSRTEGECNNNDQSLSEALSTSGGAAPASERRLSSRIQLLPTTADTRLHIQSDTEAAAEGLHLAALSPCEKEIRNSWPLFFFYFFFLLYFCFLDPFLVLFLRPCWMEDVETSSSTCWLQSSTPLKPH